jgi:hypothetical protein
MSGVWFWWIGGIVWKALLDALVLARGSNLFGERVPWLVFALTEMAHAPAVATFAVAGHFSSFEWKGQRFRSTGVKRES